MPTVEVDGEVLGHLLIMQAKCSGSLGDQVECLVSKDDTQYELPLSWRSQTPTTRSRKE